MKKLVFLLVWGSLAVFIYSARPKYLDPSQPVEARVEDLISRMSLEEKVSLLSGHGFEVSGIERLHVPPLRMSDGPAGVRWGTSTAFPAPVALAATWDPERVMEVARAMGEELKGKGRNVLLAPCVNIHRIPLGGRNFESYGEDLFLAGKIAAAFVKGVQSRRAIVCVKHYTANNQEWERTRINEIISERALHEIYIPAFRAAIQEGGALCVMAAYNKVNGSYCSDNRHLLIDILKGELGFRGFVVSDWGATHSTVKAAMNGLDLEMPYGRHFGKRLLVAVKKGLVPEEVINDKVRRILYAMLKSGVFDDKKKSADVDWKGHALLARSVAAEAMVLLKNNGILPLRLEKIHTIALVGPNAKYAAAGGGGSAMVKPPYVISPLMAFKTLEKRGIRVLYSAGVEIYGDVLPVEKEYLRSREGTGLIGEYFNNGYLEGRAILKRRDSILYFNWAYDLPDPRLEEGNREHRVSVRWRGFLLPPRSGKYRLKFLCDGGLRVFIRGKLVLNSWDNDNGKRGVSLRKVSVYLPAGKKVPIRIEYSSHPGVSEFKFGWEVPEINLTEQTVELARKADIVIFVGGLSPHLETESRDRETMDIPNQSALIEKIAKANPNTVVVLMGGSPVSLGGWKEKVSAIIQAWYPGQEGGNALLDVLTGRVNPSGKLPFSWYSSLRDCPSMKGYRSGLTVHYSEGVFVGYRYLFTEGIKSVFPFGHGLSYTQFKYSNLKIEKTPGEIVVRLRLKNIGSFPGKEVVQVYISPPKTGVPRPVIELKGFKKIFLKPGEEREVSLIVPVKLLRYYDGGSKKWKLSKGIHKILVGSSSSDIRLKGELEI